VPYRDTVEARYLQDIMRVARISAALTVALVVYAICARFSRNELEVSFHPVSDRDRMFGAAESLGGLDAQDLEEYVVMNQTGPFPPSDFLFGSESLDGVLYVERARAIRSCMAMAPWNVSNESLVISTIREVHTRLNLFALVAVKVTKKELLSAKTLNLTWIPRVPVLICSRPSLLDSSGRVFHHGLVLNPVSSSRQNVSDSSNELIESIEDPVYVISQPMDTTFYSAIPLARLAFFFEDLELAKQIKILIPDSKFVSDMLVFLGFPTERVLRGNLIAPLAILPDPISNEAPNIAAIQRLRDIIRKRLFSKLADDPPQRKQHILWLSLESNLQDAFPEEKFVSLNETLLDTTNVLRLFFESKAIIGSSSSLWSHLLICPPGTLVIREHEEIQDRYAEWLSRALALRHRGVERNQIQNVLRRELLE